MRRLVPLAALMSVGWLIPQSASASIWTQTACGGSTLQTCVDFDLSQDATGRYFFSTTFVSSHYAGDEAGVITAVGIYDLDGTPIYDLTNIVFESGLSTISNWTGHTDDPCHTTGAATGAQLFEGCADANPSPIQNGMRVGDTVVFSFALNPENDPSQILPSSFTEDSGLGARVHIQSYSEDQCSVKLDSRLAVDDDGNLTDGFFSGDDCRPSTSVPEPVSTLLLGSGLLGVGMVARRRRNGLERNDA